MSFEVVEYSCSKLSTMRLFFRGRTGSAGCSFWKKLSCWVLWTVPKLLLARFCCLSLVSISENLLAHFFTQLKELKLVWIPAVMKMCPLALGDAKEPIFQFKYLKWPTLPVIRKSTGQTFEDHQTILLFFAKRWLSRSTSCLHKLSSKKGADAERICW